MVKIIGSARLAVDVKNELLLYPEEQGLVINERQTCNFSAPENFVVFECVHRLLVKSAGASEVSVRLCGVESAWELVAVGWRGRSAAAVMFKDSLCNPPGRSGLSKTISPPACSSIAQSAVALLCWLHEVLQ